MFKLVTRLLLLLAISLSSCEISDSDEIIRNDQADLSVPHLQTEGEDDRSTEGGSGG